MGLANCRRMTQTDGNVLTAMAALHPRPSRLSLTTIAHGLATVLRTLWSRIHVMGHNGTFFDALLK